MFALNALSFVVSAALLWQARPRAIDGAAREGALRELKAGLRYVMSVPWIWSGIAVATLVLMVSIGPYNALLPRLVRQHFERGVGSYGLLFSLMAVGMVAGSLLYARWNPRRHRVLICFAAFGINDLGIVLLAASPWFPLAAFAVMWRGFWVGLAISLWTTMLTELVPEHFLARVVSMDFFGSFGLMPVGYALAGGVAGLFTPAQIIGFGGAVSFCAWIAPLSVRSIRTAA